MATSAIICRHTKRQRPPSAGQPGAEPRREMSKKPTPVIAIGWTKLRTARSLTASPKLLPSVHRLGCLPSVCPLVRLQGVCRGARIGASFEEAPARFFPRVGPLVRLQVACLIERIGASLEERFLPRVRPLVRLHIACLTERIGASLEEAPVRFLPSVSNSGGFRDLPQDSTRPPKSLA
jgi:hypothetical protein